MDKGSLIRKGLRHLRQAGLRPTWHKACQKLENMRAARAVAGQLMPAPEELDAQRAHRFVRELTFSVVVPLYNTPVDLLRQMIESVLGQTYARWELCMADGSDEAHAEVEEVCLTYAQKDERIRYQRLGENLGISGNSNACLGMATGEYVALLDHDDLLHPSALFEVIRAIEATGADFVYTDEATFRGAPQNLVLLHHKPGYAPDTLRGNNYICHLTVFERSLLSEAGLFDPSCDGSQDHDLVLRLTEQAQRVVHIPQVLYYWHATEGSVAGGVEAKPYVREAGVRAVEKAVARMGLDGTVGTIREDSTIYRVRYKLESEPLVSAVMCVPRESRARRLFCTHLEELLGKTVYAALEVVLVDAEGAQNQAPLEKLCSTHANVRLVSCATNLHDSARYNLGAREVKGSYVLTLCPGQVPTTPDWVQEMLMFAQRGDVGMVGAKLLNRSGTIAHAGIGVGLEPLVGYYYQGKSAAREGYLGRLSYAQDLSAVSGACMLVRREVWDELGGFDEGFSSSLYDVDLCLRARKLGLLVVWTPFAELCFMETRNRQLTGPLGQSSQTSATELARFRDRWRAELAAGDPYYNPNFSWSTACFDVNASAQRHDAR